MAAAVSRAWFKQPSRMATTNTGRAWSAAQRSANVAPSASGTNQPPAPSISAKSCSAASVSPQRAAKCSKRSETPASRAAMCGAMAGSRATGFAAR